MPFDTITLNLDNGEEIQAPIGMWLAALLSSMPNDQQTRIKETVAHMVEQAQNPIVRPKRHIMKAEPFNLGLAGKTLGKKNNGNFQS